MVSTQSLTVDAELPSPFLSDLFFYHNIDSNGTLVCYLGNNTAVRPLGKGHSSTLFKAAVSRPLCI